jgi:hypothetical protein
VDAKSKVIRRILFLTNSGQQAVAVIRQMLGGIKSNLQDIPDSFWEEYLGAIKTEELEDLIVPIYSAHFNEQELEELESFYSSSLGQKILAEMPKINEECVTVGQAWGAKMIKCIADRIYGGEE